MRRKYINRVEVWQKSAVSDNFGGNTQTETNLGYSWANVITVPTDKLTSYGLDIQTKTVIIKLRYRDDIDYKEDGIFFKYKGVVLIPTRVDQKNIQEEEIEILASESYGNG